MNVYSDAEQFLQAVFGSDFGTRAIFANLHPAVHTRDLQQLATSRDCYWSIATFDPGHTERHLTRALEVRAFVVDDVGSKVAAGAVELALGPPTAIVETSQGNFQWSYRLAPAIPIEQWGGFWRAIEQLVGCTLEGKDAVHLFRLPCGINTKPGRDGFAVKLIQLNPGIELSGISRDEPLRTLRLEAKGAPRDKGTLNRVQLESLMQLIPNDMERDGWIKVGHGLKASCEDDEEGFEVFDHWSLQHPSYDAAKTRIAWDSFGASGLRTEGGQLKAMAEALNPQGYAKWVFDDGVALEITPGPERKGITATPFKWMNLADTEPRDWLYGDILLRKFISMTVAPGGTGKSSLVAVETLAQITGRNLLGENPADKLRVWLWNLEDTYGETQKKILAAAKHYKIAEADIGDRLFVDSGREQKLVIAVTERNAPMIVRPVIRALVEQIRLRKIDVIVVDPFVSCHEVPENDNGAMDMVVKEWGQVAELGNCAVHLVDHTSKAGSKEVVTDSSRGAKAKTDAARVVRVVNRMSDTDGKTYGIVDTWRYFNTFNDKANMAPPKARRDWFKMESIWADNGGGAAQAFSAGAATASTLGDSIGVAVQWTPPSVKTMAAGDAYTKVIAVMGDKRWRTAPQSPNWIGIAVAEGCGLLHHSTVDKLSVKEIIKKWISEGLFKVVMQLDDNRMMREYIEIAKVY